MHRRRRVYGANRLDAKTIIWAAGVRASRARNGWVRRPIVPTACSAADLSIPGHPDIFAIGDTVTIAGPDGNPVPGIAPAAKQQGRYVAALIKARLSGGTLPPFRYKHAAAWRRSASAGHHRFRLDQAEGKPRLVDLGIAHIYFLIGLRHRLSVALSWMWVHARNQRAARLITQGSSKVTQ